LREGVIQAVGDLSGAAARRRIDAAGCIVAPGFIDSHSHDDHLLLQYPLRYPKLLQGVTTVITGNCDISLTPLSPLSPLVPFMAQAPPSPLDIFQTCFKYATFASYVSAVQAARPDLNAALLVGHTTLRVGALADLSRAATPAETASMRQAVAEALQAGAIGLSTGVFYPPACAATAQELVDVAQPLTGGGGLIAMHIRNEGDDIEAALEEAFHVGRVLGVPLVLSHHKLMGLANQGRSVQTLALIEQAARGKSVCMDCYPYTASSTMLLPERVASSSDVQITWSQAEPSAAGRFTEGPGR